MAAPKRILVPTLSEMDDEDGFEAESGSLFKRHKSSTGDSKSKQETTPSTSLITEGNDNCIRERSSNGASVDNIEKELSSCTSNEGSENSKSYVTTKPGSSNSLIVNPRQRGNPILKSVRNVPWEYGNIVADYVMGPSHCALFLSLRYHQLHPNYIHDRLKKLGRSYELRVLLVQVDVKEPHHLLKDLAKICLLADCTLILAFSTEEAGRYLETYKVFENKPAEAIMEKTEDNFMAKFVDCLTRVKSVNKTDCATLLTAFGSLSNIMDAREDELGLCPGFGPQKAKRLHNIFQEPFLRNHSKAHESQDKD